jgi:hypothetical protein
MYALGLTALHTHRLNTLTVSMRILDALTHLNLTRRISKCLARRTSKSTSLYRNIFLTNHLGKSSWRKNSSYPFSFYHFRTISSRSSYHFRNTSSRPKSGRIISGPLRVFLYCVKSFCSCKFSCDISSGTIRNAAVCAF